MTESLKKRSLEILACALDGAQALSPAEVYLRRRALRTWEFREGELTRVEESPLEGCALRLVRDGRLAFGASSATVDFKALRKLRGTLESLLTWAPQDSHRMLPRP